MTTQKPANITAAIRMLNTKKIFYEDDLTVVIPVLVFMAEKFNWKAFSQLKKYGNNWQEISFSLVKAFFKGDETAEKDLKTLHTEYFTIQGLSCGLLLFLDEMDMELEEEKRLSRKKKKTIKKSQ